MFIKQSIYFFLILAVQLPSAKAVFESGFQNFLNFQYGPLIAQKLLRTDLGQNASYGGSSNSYHMSLSHNPLILVHGLLSYAGNLMPGRVYFEQNGYSAGSVFATSYGPNGTNIGYGDELLCDYIKQVRRLIVAVHRYTGRKVVVNGYSMGSAVSRKALLGGKCLDTNQNLGRPLTSIVSAFMSIAGINQGMGLCLQIPTTQICNNLTGIFPNSKFIQNINSRRHYEGRSLYVIASLTDEVAQFANIRLPGADVKVTLSGFSHGLSMLYTLRSQTQLSLNGFLTQEVLDEDVDAASLLLGTNCTGTFEQRHH